MAFAPVLLPGHRHGTEGEYPYPYPLFQLHQRKEMRGAAGSGRDGPGGLTSQGSLSNEGSRSAN